MKKTMRVLMLIAGSAVLMAQLSACSAPSTSGALELAYADQTSLASNHTAKKNTRSIMYNSGFNF